MAHMHSLTFLMAATRYDTMIPLAETGARGWRMVIPEMTLKRAFQSFHYYSKVKGGIGCPDPCRVNGTTIHSRVKVNKVPTTSFPPIPLPETRVQVSNAHFERMQRTQGRETGCKTQGKEETTFENLEQLLLADCVTLF